MSGTDTASSSDLTRAGIDLGRIQSERLAKRLGKLQEQLVHRYGPGQPAPESAHTSSGASRAP